MIGNFSAMRWIARLTFCPALEEKEKIREFGFVSMLNQTRCLH